MAVETPVIRFFRGSKPLGTARVIPDSPIVEIAELAGVDIPTNCTSGNCGTCLVRLISGEVDLPEDMQQLLAVLKRDAERYDYEL